MKIFMGATVASWLFATTVGAQSTMPAQQEMPGMSMPGMQMDHSKMNMPGLQNTPMNKGNDASHRQHKAPTMEEQMRMNPNMKM